MRARTVEEHLTPAQVAERLNVTRWSVYLYIRTKQIKRVTKFGPNCIRIPASAVNEFLEHRTIT